MSRDIKSLCDNLRAAEGDKWEAQMQNTLYSETHQQTPGRQNETLR